MLKVKDEYLSDLTGTSGGPHGSVFAVFIFAVYINDLQSLVENSTYLFAEEVFWKSNEFIFATK